MMKKAMLTVLSTLLVTGLMAGQAAGASSPIVRMGQAQIQVLINGKKMQFPDAKPFQDAQGSVMVPIRFISETLGAKVDLGQAEGNTIVTVTDAKHTIRMTVDQTAALVNGVKKDYGTKVIIQQNRTYVPLRLVGEGLGQAIEWDSTDQWVWIGSKEVPNIEDVTTTKEVSSYKKFFKNNQRNLLLNHDNQEYPYVRVLEMKQLPIQTKDTVIYDIFLVKDKNQSKIQVHYKGAGTGLELFFLSDAFEPRLRVSESDVKQSDGTKIALFPITYIGDKVIYKDEAWKSFTLKKFEYICFRSTYDEDSVHLLVNPFK